MGVLLGRTDIVGRRAAAVLQAVPIFLPPFLLALGWFHLFGARGLAFAWLLALVFCPRDLETAVLYYPPGHEPLTVRLFTLEANGPEGVVAGLALVQVAMTALVLAAGGWLLPRSRSA
jgi:ABC-type Fe3+ transport system permease subunit